MDGVYSWVFRFYVVDIMYIITIIRSPFLHSGEFSGLVVGGFLLNLNFILGRTLCGT